MPDDASFVMPGLMNTHVSLSVSLDLYVQGCNRRNSNCREKPRLRFHPQKGQLIPWFLDAQETGVQGGIQNLKCFVDMALDRAVCSFAAF